MFNLSFLYFFYFFFFWKKKKEVEESLKSQIVFDIHTLISKSHQNATAKHIVWCQALSLGSYLITSYHITM